MKNFNYIFIAILLSVFTSCSTAYVASDYDRGVDFNQYKTYNFYSNIDWKQMNKLDQDRMLNAIESEFKEDGLMQSNTPDIWVDVIVDEKLVKRQTGSVGLGSGSFGGGVNVGISMGIPISSKKINKNYIIEMVDAKNEHLIWQGVYEKDASPRANNQVLIPQAIKQIFQKFPPKK